MSILEEGIRNKTLPSSELQGLSVENLKKIYHDVVQDSLSGLTLDPKDLASIIGAGASSSSVNPQTQEMTFIFNLATGTETVKAKLAPGNKLSITSSTFSATSQVITSDSKK
jgi:hypothetical protein